LPSDVILRRAEYSYLRGIPQIGVFRNTLSLILQYTRLRRLLTAAFSVRFYRAPKISAKTPRNPFLLSARFIKCGLILSILLPVLPSSRFVLNDIPQNSREFFISAPVTL
jgi:hypothetical protein